LNIHGDDGDGRRRGGGAGVKGSGSGGQTDGTATRATSSAARGGRRAHQQATTSGTRLHRPAAAGCRISDSGWRTQVAAAARLMAADGCGLRQRAKHVEDDKGEL
jgi:hypothetical protein